MINEYLRLLERKRDIIKEIYELTRSARLGDTVDGVDAYVAFIDQREILINELKTAESELTGLSATKPADARDMDAKRLIAETDEFIKQIAVLEKQNKPKIGHMMNSIKQNLKEINDSKAVTNRYLNTDAGSGGQYFDEKK